MANAFSKEEIVAFEQVVEGFEDNEVLSRNVNVYSSDSQSMERANDIIWRPMPYTALSFSGTDQTANFNDQTQLSVPSAINITRSSPWVMTSLELRDALQNKRLGVAARQKLSSDINVSVMDLASNQGTLVVKRTVAASGFDDVAQCEAIMNEQGVSYDERYLALSTRDYNGMANNLAARTLGNSAKSLNAYERAKVGVVGSFNTSKLDYANRLTAAAGTTVTVNGANQYYTPASVSVAAGGEESNVDNRYQTINLTVGGGTVAVGDCFTIAGVFAVHHITKRSTGELKTFRITSLLASSGATGAMQISPAIVSGGGATTAELQYQNVDSTPASGAALVFLNNVTTQVNPFWKKEAIEILPGRHVIEQNSGVGVLRATSGQGIELVMTKQYDINTMKTKYRLDTFYGVVMTNPEMCGVMLFNQT